MLLNNGKLNTGGSLLRALKSKLVSKSTLYSYEKMMKT